ncbi:MAG: Non-ribosomal peptide synthetase component, partial [Conexibacter sp.]|nr:Non-ribosomal peptide synthetase component [Conexibacter sp.]
MTMRIDSHVISAGDVIDATAAELSPVVAIIGMSGRFPGAGDADQYWENLLAGTDSITRDVESRPDGLARESGPGGAGIRAGGVLADVELFDAGYFGYPPSEAAAIDPQHRLFLEHSKAALDDAACAPEQFNGAIGVFAGMSESSYRAQLLADADARGTLDALQVELGNGKDFLPLRVSYKLSLRGPSISVQTACSTSLVAVHMACQSLLNGECDVALAGGVSVHLPQLARTVTPSGGIRSPDGYCRAYDVSATGTVGGNGVGVVVLKRLADALADGDAIRAVIRGSAINNDGSEKVGFTAPSVAGQARVITEALAVAGVAPVTVGFVEGHGTGTSLGDPIEVAALTKAYRGGGDLRVGECALGSVKPNIGHLDAAAGVAG